MIDKDKAKKSGFNIIDAGETRYNDTIEKIKKIIPGVVNSDNILNIKALADIIDISNTTSNNQGYELTFAGKGLAKAMADIPTKKELKIETKQSKNFDNTENVIIRGDNIDALKILKQNYFNKIKMIYIDPPYNTTSDEFIYKDNFKETDAGLIEKFGLNEDNINYLTNIYGTRTHSGWLSFMYPRLKLARDLLSDDGVIFISIDDNEQAGLKLICDEIFGEENFVVSISRECIKGGSQSKDIRKVHDYILCFSKNKEESSFSGFETEGIELNMQDSKGKYARGRELNKWGAGSRREDCPGMYFPVKGPNNEDVYPIRNDGSEGRWRWGKKRMVIAVAEEDVIFEKRKDGTYIVYEKIRESKPGIKQLLSLFKDNYLNSKGTDDLKKLFDCQRAPFEYSKPKELITDLMILSDCDNSDIVMDFFAGSGTTANSVLEYNQENGSECKFILIQFDEKIEKIKIGYDFCINNNLEPLISSICIERVNRAGDKLKDDLLSADLDVGYKVFSLVDKPMIKHKDNHFELFGHREQVYDTLFNMLVATSQTLSSKIEEIERDRLYRVNKNYYVLGKSEMNFEELKDCKIFIDGYSNLNIEDYLNMDISNKENMSIIY